MKGSVLINALYDHCNKFFQDSGLLRDFGFESDGTIVPALFTDDDSKIEFQDPHNDHPYVITRRNYKDQVQYSWMAHLPLTQESS